MKKIIVSGQRRNKHFLIVIYHSSLVRVKGAMNAAHLCKLRNGVKNASISSFFNGQRWTKCTMNILRSYLNWWHNWQVKNRRRSHSLQGSHSKGDGQIFLKTRRDASFNKDLSNEPNFDRIHLAGQYLYIQYRTKLPCYYVSRLCRQKNHSLSVDCVKIKCYIISR